MTTAADLTTSQLNDAVRAAGDANLEVSDDVARCIAGYWHDGQTSALYSFASSGRYDRAALLAELSDVIHWHYRVTSPASRQQLDALGTYLVNRREA